MSGDLKNEMAVATLIQMLIPRQAPDRQTAQNEWPSAKAKILRPLLAFDPDQLDSFGLTNLLFGDHQIAVQFFEDLAGGLQRR